MDTDATEQKPDALEPGSVIFYLFIMVRLALSQQKQIQ